MTDHAALLADIDRAGRDERDAYRRMWDAEHAGNDDAYTQAAADWLAAANERATLIRAGVLVTLGPIGDTTP